MAAIPPARPIWDDGEWWSQITMNMYHNKDKKKVSMMDLIMPQSTQYLTTRPVEPSTPYHVTPADVKTPSYPLFNPNNQIQKPQSMKPQSVQKPQSVKLDHKNVREQYKKHHELVKRVDALLRKSQAKAKPSKPKKRKKPHKPTKAEQKFLNDKDSDVETSDDESG